MTDASFRSASFALMVENIPDQKIKIQEDIFRNRRVRFKNLLPAQLNLSLYSKEILTISMGIFEFARTLWETWKLTIVLTDNKSVTLFYQTKAIPPALWNAFDFVSKFNFKLAHIVGSVNTAATFSPDWNWKSRRRSVSKSGRIYKQHPPRWHHLPRMLQIRNNSSSHKQMVTMRLKNICFNVKNSLTKRRQNG